MWAHHMHTKCRKLYTPWETGLHTPQKKPQDLECPLCSICGAVWEGNDRNHTRERVVPLFAESPADHSPGVHLASP